MTRLFGCVCGQFHSPGAGLGMAAERVAVPVPFYVIEHPEGVALFDAGLHDDMQDADDPYRQRLREGGMDVSLTAEETVASHLERLEIDAAKVRYVVLSHLHFDHAGGLSALPNATLVVQSKEWAAGADEETSRRYFLPKRFFDLGHQLRLVDGEHDLFGDGSVTCIPSHGHTPGHQSLRVRSDQGDHILVGDACYTAESAVSRNFPAYADHAAMNRSLDALMAMRGPQTVMIYGHDPGQWGERALLPGVRG
ncbi:N-acyl homoserine lactonase family protein [Phenylobacterium sp.]|uniref:N-acyl homoserine lactonase family protein n=1 Tax=Phenylobacterium sp. TaxID=1871053 RepID=UPI002CF3187C|nr:N-acyl homoserine lactonase family protein [Phenylobacterium sp.]HVI33366.1 N-acyl homoserine lactonase family protein [Phenylobacterium sp.]